MSSRVTSAVLFGLGVLALVFAAGLAFIVGPRVSQLPYDLERTQSVAEAPNATFLQIKDGGVAVNQGTLRSTITVQPEAEETAKLEGDLDGKAAVWLVGQQVVRTDTNELISAYSTLLALDRKSANTLPWDKAWLDTGNDRQKVSYTGQIYKFPFGTEKKTYQIFDRDINAAQPAVFVKTEKIEGLETYQFTQEIRGGRQEVPADRLQLLLGALIPGATSGQVVYNNTRTVWVEPTTGQYLKVQEVQEKNLVADSGQSVKLLDATFTYTDATIADAADNASSNRQLLRIVNLWAPIGLLVIGLILIAVALLLTMRRRNAGRHAGPPAPAPAGDGSVKAST
jgi:hypothetical protein